MRLTYSYWFRALTGGEHRCNLSVLALASSLMSSFFLFTSYHYFAGGAGSFLQYARAIAFGEHTLGIAQRDIGYPLLIVASLFLWTGSLRGVVLIHALMAYAMPLLVYIALPRAWPRVALTAAAFCIASLAPYMFIKMYYHDQAYMFAMLVAVLLYLRFIARANPACLYLFTLVMLYACFTRPAGNFLFPVLLACCFLFYRTLWKHYLACAAIFAALSFANYEYRRWIMGLAPGETMPSYVGHQLFYNVYAHSREAGIVLRPEDGPGLARLAEEIRKEFPRPRESPYLLYYRQQAPEFYQEALNVATGEELAARMFARPYAEYFIIFHSMPATAHDSALFLQASWDVIRRHPLYPLRYALRNTHDYFFRPGMSFGRMRTVYVMGRNDLEYYARLGGVAHEAGLTGRAAAEMVDPSPYFDRLAEKLRTKTVGGRYSKINRYSVWLNLVAAAAILASLVSRPADRLLGGHMIARAYTGLLAILLYHAFITGLMAEPLWRYHYMTMPIQLIGAGFGLVVLAHALQRLHSQKYKE